MHMIDVLAFEHICNCMWGKTGGKYIHISNLISVLCNYEYFFFLYFIFSKNSIKK